MYRYVNFVVSCQKNDDDDDRVCEFGEICQDFYTADRRPFCKNFLVSSVQRHTHHRLLDDSLPKKSFSHGLRKKKTNKQLARIE